MTTTTDRIEKQLDLAASPARVWQALSDSSEFGTWFGMRFDAPFEPGATVRGEATMPNDDCIGFEMQIVEMQPERLFSYRWHPHAVKPDHDYTHEPTTLVEFRLEAHGGGTRVTVIESGFDALPDHRRDEAFRMNSGGWAMQVDNLVKHVAAS